MANTTAASAPHSPLPTADSAGSVPAAAISPPRVEHVLGSILSTISGPARPPADEQDGQDLDSGEVPGVVLATEAQRKLVLSKMLVQRGAAQMPANPNKAAEFGQAHALQPREGAHADPVPEDEASGSTLSEVNDSKKVGDGLPRTGHSPLSGPLDRVRVDSRDRMLTTNQGVPIGDNQNSLKAGLRGPTLLEDFILREKITHFDHERIPERVVHARGSGAFGVFECYDSQQAITRADLLSSAGKQTPVFVRFSTVAGERGSADTVRDTRGFAVKFYTDEGNWDLVGNNMPVFFIQDAMKFPDLIHAVKPEPHNGMPQAASAHDTFWDFVSLMPESIHHTLWAMSDRGIPRSYRTMQGFGVHTFKLVNAAGEAVFVKFHWLPTAGTHSLVWDEAAKICGADADFHRRDLWEAIEAGQFPQWELALQVFTPEQAETFSFDVLDATKLIPEELVPLRVVGKMTLDRNPDNFFAETEQVAFCTAHLVPGIDFSNDPLLQGRIHSYLDTQISRLGGANFHEIPVNAPITQVHNNQRDGMHRQAIHRGRAAYEPNSLGGGCPHQAGMAGFVSAAQRTAPVSVSESTIEKLRGKPEKFADHVSQAQLFWRSQSPVEKRHIISAYRFELTRVSVPAIRERVVSQLRNVDPQLARGVADGIGIALPAPQPLALEVLGLAPVMSEVETSTGLSLFSRPGNLHAAGRRVALLVTDGVNADALREVQRRLLQADAVPQVVGLRLGRVLCSQGRPIEIETTVEAMPSVLWDAVVLPTGEGQAGAALSTFAADPNVQDFIRQQYQHGKPILVLGRTGRYILAKAGLPLRLADDQPDPGLVLSEVGGDDGPAQFIGALGRHRRHEREQG